MRILVADQNALLLAGIVSTFGRHCEVVVASRRDECVAHLEAGKFDVVVACEKLSDYTGLELLSEVTALSPQTLRVFSARPETLKRLGARLDFFGLLGTLSYPIEMRKLLVALKVARGKLAHRSSRRAAAPKPPQPTVRHVVLEESEWDTGVRLGLLERELETAASGGNAPVGHGGPAEPEQIAVATRAGDGHSATHQAKASRGTAGGVSGAGAGAAAPATSNSAGAVERLGANASDVRVVDSAAWETRPSQVAVDNSGSIVAASSSRAGVDAGDASAGSATRKTSARATAAASARTEKDSLEVSFDEMPGAIAVARIRPTADAPKGAPPPAGSKPRSLLEQACNDPDIDAPLPVETYGAANEPLYDNEPGKGGVRAPGSSNRGSLSESNTRGASGAGAQAVDQRGGTSGAGATTNASATPAAPTARGAADTSGARATPTARGAADTSGARATPTARGAQDSGGTTAAAATRSASNVRANGDASGAHAGSGAHASSGARGTADASGARGASGGRGGAKAAGSPGAANKGAEKGPKVRKPTVPTAAQRQAFQRALARRNAARLGGGSGFDDGDIPFGAEADEVGGDVGDAASGAQGAVTPGVTPDVARKRSAAHSADRSTPFISTQSLSDLAKMANTKRPLKELNRGTSLPKRRVLVYGSGVVAALLAVMIFQLTKATHGEHGHNAQVQETSTHVFGPTSTQTANGGAAGPTPQLFTPTPPQAAAPASSLPQPQHFDPNNAPPDPPPPPAVEHPGPVEPPS